MNKSNKKHDQEPKKEKKIDKVLDKTFPASDPPAWMAGSTGVLNPGDKDKKNTKEKPADKD